MGKIAELRRAYHIALCEKVIRLRGKQGQIAPNFADSNSSTSRDIATLILEQLGCSCAQGKISGQKAGRLFESITRSFLAQSFELLNHLRPGEWQYTTGLPITAFDQYAHLADLARLVDQNEELKAALGEDYIIRPDIVISRMPVSDEQINASDSVVDAIGPCARHTPLRAINVSPPRQLLHASISCKWTVRSDRAQNTRTEALNLIRNRKGHLPHVMIVTAEPMPTRLASLALGTGDVDCVYHIALDELQQVIVTLQNEDQLDMLATLIDGRRLRDISDLPLDLAI
jgi:hypothetical protein